MSEEKVAEKSSAGAMSSRGLISIGWWGYFACAAVYVIAGLRAGDWFGLLGSLFFLGATVAFILEHYRVAPIAERSDKEQEQ